VAAFLKTSRVRRKRAAPSPEQQKFYVTDGRIGIGIVEVIADAYAAINPDGIEVGRFNTLAAAVRALPSGGVQ
jgi:hypothetical protein